MGTGSRGRGSHNLDLNALKPILRAYVLGYVTVTGPRLFSLLKIVGRKDKSSKEKLALLAYILRTSLQLNRFPATCAIIIGGATVLPRLVLAFIQELSNSLGRKTSIFNKKSNIRLVYFLSSFISAWLGFKQLNSRRISASHARSEPSPRSDPPLNPLGASGPSTPALRPVDPLNRNLSSSTLQPLAGTSNPLGGKTMDLTLFAAIRASDVLIGTLWSAWSAPRKHANKLTRFESLLAQLIDPFVFSLSSSLIMWSWFYLPHRLPRTYQIWISEAAQIDSRLIEVLRLARAGKWIYGVDTGLGSILSTLCTDLSLPPSWGDPALTIPIPCHLVHMHSGPNCEYHALSRFLRTFRFAMSTYLPLQIALRLRSRSERPLRQSLMSGLTASTRSSSFLALFVTLFYYSVCLSRTRLGPKLFPRDVITPQMWDSGLCVASGCAMCGWSILLETPSRRQEIAFFVAPRALATILPRMYERSKMWREGLIFAVSIAVVLTAVRERPGRVRGVLGRILKEVVGVGDESMGLGMARAALRG